MSNIKCEKCGGVVDTTKAIHVTDMGIGHDAEWYFCSKTCQKKHKGWDEPKDDFVPANLFSMGSDRETNEPNFGVDIHVVKDDITKREVDIIVNAAHEHLTGGRGVDGAIHEAAGQKLLGECLHLYGYEDHLACTDCQDGNCEDHKSSEAKEDGQE